jgi:class 3 adenylate cyclase
VDREPEMLGGIIGGAEDPLCYLGQRFYSLTAARTGAHQDQLANEIGRLQRDFLRRRLLRTDATAKESPARAASSLAQPHQDTAECRQITVMFSDLVGSMAPSARMDPEDLREVISAYPKCVAETVRRFGGFVAKYLGDGVLI